MQEINRSLKKREYSEISGYFMSLGFNDGLVQDLDSNDPKYTPAFK